MKPTISICIPTYNRHLWLKSALSNWLPQVKAFEESVELVVADDASTDETADVIEEARAWGTFVYHRNDVNIGMFSNYAKLVSIAGGEFIWMVGDDTVPRSCALSRCMGALKRYPALDIFCVNYSHWFPREPPTELLRTDDFDLESAALSRFKDTYVDRVADLLKFDSTLLSFSHSLIWRHSLAKYAFPPIDLKEYHTSLRTAFPHAEYIAKNLLDKPAYYIGYPVLVNALSPRFFSWSKYWYITALRWIPELADE